jgi:Tfp pilus assembly PilM family ATPase
MARTRGLRSWFTSPPPGVAVEISARAVTAVGLAAGDGRPVLARQATVELPPGTVAPALNAHNVTNRPALADAVRQALDKVGRPRRIGLVLPDPVARLSIVRLDVVPPRAEDRDQLVRFQVRKAAPFASELAHFSSVPSRRLDGGAQEFVVALARRDVIEEYEHACDAAGAHAGVIDLATCCVLNLAVRLGARPGGAQADGDWMLVHLAPTYGTVAIVRGETPILFRNRAAEAEGPLADVVHQSAMYYEDRLEGAGLRRVVLAGVDSLDEGLQDLERVLRERLRSEVDYLDLRRAVQVTDRIDLPPGLAASLAPPVGLALREAF